MATKTSTFDVIVVGSGPGGGIAAYALTRAGARVALVEAGRRLRPGIDYNAHGNVYEKLEARLKAGFTHPVSSVWRDFAEKDHFVAVGDNPRHGLLRALGGRSLCWAGHSLRFGPGDFRRWPISYEEVAPYYERAERLMQVHGEKNGLWNLPDGVFEKPVPMRLPEQKLKLGVERLKARGRKMEFVPQRKAIPTERKPGGRTVCHYCGNCMAGCEVDSKYTSANTAIPLALKTGRLTVFTECFMRRIEYDPRSNRVTGIEYVDATGRSSGLRARVLVLACSAVETARHLLINGLANSSGQVGRNLTSHFGVTVVGEFPDLRTRDVSNDDGTDYYHSLLTGLYWDSPNPKFEGTYQVQCGAGLNPRRLIVTPAGFGKGYVKELIAANAAHASMNMQGSTLVTSQVYVDLDPVRKDRWGLPLPRLHLHYSDSDLAMARDMVATCEEIIRVAGGRVLQTPGEIRDAKSLVIDSNHWVGTARMGTDPRTSVVNTSCQSHDIPNLFIGDASVFAANPEKNPTLTNIALAWRMSDLLASKLKKGEF
ncbi:MAG: GMC family oxidoreductase [Bryobacteraceae bacterium]|nr:GMC family oxidoreductase [Bryobacteraceae bacterium]MDW8378493.1 GMC family oxidoreductase [Bryobacterales bacterium]